MRMNQQYQPRANGFAARHKYNKNSENTSNYHGQRHQQNSSAKQEFKPVAILKRGDPSSTAIVENKEENQSKENIAANGQQNKTTTYRQILVQPTTGPSVILASTSTKPSGNVSPPVPSPSSNTPVASTSVSTTNSYSGTVPPPSVPSIPQIISRPSGPINLIRSSTILSKPILTSNQHEQHVQSITNRLFSSTMTMKSSLKLIDENLSWCENGQLNNYLQESDGFVVIGAIGREKVGKSTLLSLLGGNQFIDEDRLMIFPAASSNSHKITRGIDIYITNEQTILLDTQPLLSSQLHQQEILQLTNDYHRSQNSSTFPSTHLWQQQTDPRSMFIDNILELQTLEIIAFILAVCHVVLIVEDQFADPYFYRLLQLAESLRPVLKRNSNEILRTHSPHLVFILNKCHNYISPQERQLIKRTLAQIMIDSHFQIYSSLKSTNKIQIQTNLKNVVTYLKQQELNENLLMKLLHENPVDPEIDVSMNNEENRSFENVNAVFVPRRDFRDSHSSHWQTRFLALSNADSIVRQLRQQLLAIDRPHIEQCQNQRAWLTHASRIWDMITKSSQLAEFSRLLT